MTNKRNELTRAMNRHCICNFHLTCISLYSSQTLHTYCSFEILELLGRKRLAKCWYLKLFWQTYLNTIFFALFIYLMNYKFSGQLLVIFISIFVLNEFQNLTGDRISKLLSNMHTARYKSYETNKTKKSLKGLVQLARIQQRLLRKQSS